MVSETGKLHFQFYLLLINLKGNSNKHKQLVASVLDSADF